LHKHIRLLDVWRQKVPYFPDYMSHLNISRAPLFLPKIWGKFIDKSHLSISRTLFCYFLARRNVLGCIHVMRRSSKERQDAIDMVQKTRGLNSVGKSLRWCSNLMPSQDIGSVPHDVIAQWRVWIKVRSASGGQSCVLSTGHQAGVFPRSAGACSRRPRPRIDRQRERERERHGGRGRGGYTAAETVSDCEVLWVSWSWSSADRGTP